jgi:hypothetical protein
LHVHDEVVVEVPVSSGHSLEEYKDLCERRPDWAAEMGIPVFAKVWERERWAEGVDIPVRHTPGAVITPDQLVKLHRNKVEKPKPAKPKQARSPGPRPDLAAAPPRHCQNEPPAVALPIEISGSPASQAGADQTSLGCAPTDPAQSPTFVQADIGRTPPSPSAQPRIVRTSGHSCHCARSTANSCSPR